jgi:hypothetical protein
LNLHPRMTEVEFIEALDASFSFDTDEEYENATRIACSISDNAVLMVGYEIATRSSAASLKTNLDLLRIMKDERPTPVIIAALPVIERLLKNEEPSSQEVQILLEACRRHGNAWIGLGIVEMADETLEGGCDEIRSGYQPCSS